MATVDLTTPPRQPESLLDGLPRRVALTLPSCGSWRGSPATHRCPSTSPSPGPGALEDRMGQSRASAEDAAYLAALGSPARPRRLPGPPRAPRRRHRRRRSGGRRRPARHPRRRPRPRRPRRRRAGQGLAPRGRRRGRDPGHRRRHRLRAGVVRRAAVARRARPGSASCPRTCRSASAVPDHVDLPFDLASAAAEAMRTGRSDLLPVLVTQHAGRVVDGEGGPDADRDVRALLPVAVRRDPGGCAPW